MSEIIREEYVNKGVLRWLFSKRRLFYRDTTITFNLEAPMAVGSTFFDPLLNQWHRAKEFLDIEPKSSTDASSRQGHKWLCEQYREIPSRWEILKTHISWFFKRIFRGYIFMNDYRVGADLRRRGEL